MFVNPRAEEESQGLLVQAGTRDGVPRDTEFTRQLCHRDPL